MDARKPPRHAVAVTETARQAIRRHLLAGAHTARDLSALVHLPEREVVSHVEHLARSARGAGDRFEVEPSRCRGCGFVFRDRRRLGKPSACPRCRDGQITAPIFRLIARRRVAVDRDAVARDWAARGFSCAPWTDPPGQRWEDFVHAADELVLLVEGALEMAIDGRTLAPSVGEEVLVPAGARHSVRNVGGTVARWLYGYRR